MLAAALFTIVVLTNNIDTIYKTCGQPERTPTGDWLKTTQCRHTTEYYAAMKKNGTLPFATTRMDLEGITLSETRQRKTSAV